VRVLVDTSVWVDFINGHPSPEAEALAGLIREEADVLTCGLVAAEFLQGIRDPESRTTLERHFRDMVWVTPTEPETYLEAARLYRQLRAAGTTIRSTVDCLIARLAHEHQCLLLAKDRDMSRILESGLVAARAYPVPEAPRDER
jgi:predicted nucleic acid-binding protein